MAAHPGAARVQESNFLRRGSLLFLQNRFEIRKARVYVFSYSPLDEGDHEVRGISHFSVVSPFYFRSVPCNRFCGHVRRIRGLEGFCKSNFILNSFAFHNLLDFLLALTDFLVFTLPNRNNPTVPSSPL